MSTKNVPSGFSEAWEVVKRLELVGTNGETYHLDVRRSLDPNDAQQPYGTSCWVEVEDENGRVCLESVPAGIMFPAATAEEAESVGVSGLGMHESRTQRSEE